MANDPAKTQTQTQGPVEARSLSSITALAANPPAYPRNPTQKPLEPLVLYIVRVPGSTDVFLTPLKPPTKASISAEAINASLYYLHVPSPHDEAVLQSIELEQELKRQQKPAGEREDAIYPAKQTEEFARLNNVKRKPVGGASQSPPPPVPPPHQQQLSTATDEPVAPPLPPRPVPLASMVGTQLTNSQALSTPVDGHGIAVRGGDDDIPRRILPRRPLPPLPSEDLSSSPTATEKMDRNPKRWSAQPDYLHGRIPAPWKEPYDGASGGRYSLDAGRPLLRPNSSHNAPLNGRGGSPVRRPAQSPTRGNYENAGNRSDSGFYITLIRRDPTHGIQWNVGTISNSGADNSTIDLEISTPGYGRFAGHNAPLSLESLGYNPPSGGRDGVSPSPSSIRPNSSVGRENNDDAPEGQTGPKTFRRTLHVSTPPSHRHQRSRGSSKGSFDFSTQPVADDGNGSPPKFGPSKLKSGYYTFKSPWNGTCTFVTSVNGRSLKCKHLIPGPSTAENPAATVAEIRFNIPFTAGHPHHHHHHHSHHSPFSLSQAGALSSKDGGKRGSLALLLNPNTYRPHSHSLSSADSPFNIHRSSHLRSFSDSSTDTDENQPPPLPDHEADPEDRLDLSLARERAGGGLRGKSAKLGKLVVEDEGIKMLDLVVAACMGVWWRAYYHA